MTLYAGETTRIQTTATDLDAETPLTSGDVVGAFVTIFRNSDKTEILAETAMVYSGAVGGWLYDWDTTGVAAGTYLAKIRLEGTDFDTWEFLRIRLNRNPAPVEA